ncbi:MAG TPA: efflux RND transporter permease subunit [Thermoanaerobaculia bacterium]|nr:efflux RND transporter permease subunit [Thermoanaerobaculia bacterium]
MNLPSISIRRPVFALMLIASLVVLGLVSLFRLDLDLNPRVDFPFVTVTTLLPGAAPETIETEVTDLLEEEINTIEGIRTLGSSSMEGLSNIFVEFELGYDIDVKAQQVREKIAPIRRQLPLDVEEPIVSQLDPDAAPILSVMLGGPVSLKQLSDLAENVVAERLERLPGVGSVSIVGARKREIRIWLDPVRLAGYGIAIDDVRSTLLEENAEMAGGRIEGAAREWTVTTSGKVRRVEDFGSLIAAQRAGRLVYLRDVAVIEDGLAEESSIARFNGQRGVSLDVRRRSGANTVAVARAVRVELDALRSELPPGSELTIARDMAVFIEDSIEAIFIDMLWGCMLVVLVVLLFLRNARSTLIAGLAIPSSLIASFTFFYVAGFTLNMMTLMALALSIGIVIDDAIVVLEVVYRRIERGEPAMTAAENGSQQVMLAVLSTTLALCAVFVPIAFLEGSVGQWFYEFGIVMAIAVLVSTLFALTFTPMMASRILSASQAQGRLARTLERGLGALDRGYAWILRRAMRHRWITLAAALAATLGGFGVASTLPFDFFGMRDRGEFTVSVKLPVGTPLQVTDRVARRMEDAVGAIPEVRDMFATVGEAGTRRPHIASIYLAVGPKRGRERTQLQLMGEARGLVREAIPEAEEIAVSEIQWVSGSSFGSKSLMYSLQGPDLARLEGHAAQLMARMNADPDLVDVGTSWETGKPEIELSIARDVAADLGVPAVAIGRTIRTLLAGEKVGSFEEGGERYDVRMQVLPEYRDDPERLDLVHVRGARGELIPITNVARARIGSGPVSIEREDRARRIVVDANTAPGVAMSTASAKVMAYGSELGIAAPDNLVPSGRVRSMQETAVSILFAFGLALLAIYMVLASLFNSLVHPFTIMISAPLSFIGGFLALKLSGTHLDMMSAIAFLVLMGLVMKNGILLVDHTNQHRAAGRSSMQAALEAAPERLRPVLMTSVALILGLVPTALSNSTGSESRAAMAVLTIGGMATSTLLTLLVVPVVYVLVDAATEGVTRGARKLVRLVLRRRTPPPESPAERKATL